MTGGCCFPTGTADDGRPPTSLRRRVKPTSGDDRHGRHTVEQVHVPAGQFAMGDSRGDGNRADGETPVHNVELPPFDIDATTVTVADDADIMGRPAETPWWLGVRGADWRHPEGPLSDVAGRLNHPVVHVSWNDSQAYCAWADRRLPTEAEWERASRGGREHARYPWGDELLTADGEWRCNIWQGSFPGVNTGDDGWITTAPVRTYQPNDFGLWQSVGNVWEWCADAFNPNAHHYAATRQRTPSPHARAPRVLRGGSYLCHDSYCNRYRNSARSQNTADS